MDIREDEECKEAVVCISVLCGVVRVFSLASGVASCLFCASYACYAFCTLDSVAASARALPFFSRFARSTYSVDKLGGVAAALSGV